MTPDIPPRPPAPRGSGVNQAPPPDFEGIRLTCLNCQTVRIGSIMRRENPEAPVPTWLLTMNCRQCGNRGWKYECIPYVAGMFYFVDTTSPQEGSAPAQETTTDTCEACHKPVAPEASVSDAGGRDQTIDGAGKIICGPCAQKMPRYQGIQLSCRACGREHIYAIEITYPLTDRWAPPWLDTVPCHRCLAEKLIAKRVSYETDMEVLEPRIRPGDTVHAAPPVTSAPSCAECGGPFLPGEMAWANAGDGDTHGFICQRCANDVGASVLDRANIEIASLKEDAARHDQLYAAITRVLDELGAPPVTGMTLDGSGETFTTQRIRHLVKKVRKETAEKKTADVPKCFRASVVTQHTDGSVVTQRAESTTARGAALLSRMMTPPHEDDGAPDGAPGYATPEEATAAAALHSHARELTGDEIPLDVIRENVTGPGYTHEDLGGLPPVGGRLAKQDVKSALERSVDKLADIIESMKAIRSEQLLIIEKTTREPTTEGTPS